MNEWRPPKHKYTAVEYGMCDRCNEVFPCHEEGSDHVKYCAAAGQYIKCGTMHILTDEQINLLSIYERNYEE
jgi:hypothetical protein